MKIIRLLYVGLLGLLGGNISGKGLVLYLSGDTLGFWFFIEGLSVLAVTILFQIETGGKIR